ncbi:MAG: ATP-binding protein [Simkaniaceae bacterium]|nr:MAG: ATP-binding protein [Simkaniaceae bacterium]
MKKRYLFPLMMLIVASCLCFITPSLYRFREWLLFLILFGITALFQRFASRKKNRSRHSLIDGLQEGVVILDWEGKVLEVNHKGKKIIPGISVGSPFFNHSMMNGHQTLFQTLKETRINQTTTVSGEKSVAHLELSVLDARKRVLATLIDRYEHYQKEQLGKDFVANASHELRTPITIIKGFAETIYDLPEISEVMLQDFTEKIVRNCERMDNLVKNLLTLADLDYLPKARLQECDLVGLVDNCSQTLLTLYPEIQIESLHNHELIVIDGDPDLLELAVMNLLENAVKYSSPEALITITVEDCLESAALTISDRGVGIPSEDLEKIFDRFYTINKSHSRQLGGAGLGLSIVKTIVSKHDAKIDVSSAVGKGTTFTLTFEKATALSL